MMTPCPPNYSLVNGTCVYTGQSPSQCGPGYVPDNNGNCVKLYSGCPVGYQPNAYGQCVPIHNRILGMTTNDWVVLGSIATIFVALFTIFIKIKPTRRR